MVSVYQFLITNPCENIASSGAESQSPRQTLQQVFTEGLVAPGLDTTWWLAPTQSANWPWKLTAQHILLVYSSLWRWLRLLPLKEEFVTDFQPKGAAILCRPTGKAGGVGLER